MGVQTDITYLGGLKCEAVHGPSGQLLLTEAPTDNGGTGQAFSPTDLVATAVGACMMTLMGIVAGRLGVDIQGIRTRVVKEMISTPKRRIGAVKVVLTMPAGKDYAPDVREQLEQAALRCPVKESLHPDIDVSVEFEYPQ